MMGQSRRHRYLAISFIASTLFREHLFSRGYYFFLTHYGWVAWGVPRNARSGRGSARGDEWSLEGEEFPLPTIASGSLPPLLGLRPATKGEYPLGSPDLSFWERQINEDGRVTPRDRTHPKKEHICHGKKDASYYLYLFCLLRGIFL